MKYWHELTDCQKRAVGGLTIFVVTFLVSGGIYLYTNDDEDKYQDIGLKELAKYVYTNSMYDLYKIFDIIYNSFIQFYC